MKLTASLNSCLRQFDALACRKLTHCCILGRERRLNRSRGSHGRARRRGDVSHKTEKTRGKQREIILIQKPFRVFRVFRGSLATSLEFIIQPRKSRKARKLICHAQKPALFLLKTPYPVTLLRALRFSCSLVQSPCLFFVSASPQHARDRRAADAQKPCRFLLIALRIAQHPLQNQLRILF